MLVQSFRDVSAWEAERSGAVTMSVSAVAVAVGVCRLETAIELLVREMEQRFKHVKVAIAFPDDGAEKRFAKLFNEDWQRIVCAKRREADRRVITIKEGMSRRVASLLSFAFPSAPAPFDFSLP